MQQASAGTLAPLAPPVWYRLTVLLLTALTVGVSVGIAWHFYGTLLTTTGVLAWWAQIHATLNAAINAGWHTLYTTFPLSQQVIESLPTCTPTSHGCLRPLCCGSPSMTALPAPHTTNPPASTSVRCQVIVLIADAPHF